MFDGFLSAKRLIIITRRFVFWRQHHFHCHISNDYNRIRSRHYPDGKSLANCKNGSPSAGKRR
ncbi:hypothetical protein EAO94_19930 [Salmonella enterica subsp. enterica serovar Okatie]|nr:hypothetical protein [Salmonella enterica]EBZ3868124.1 hypothetical protein [Salmonella enterica subsp. enterica serovar Okatie]